MIRNIAICDFIDTFANVGKVKSSSSNFGITFYIRFDAKAETQICLDGMSKLNLWFLYHLGKNISLQNSSNLVWALGGSDGDGVLDCVYEVTEVLDSFTKSTKYIDRQPINTFVTEFAVKVKLISKISDTDSIYEA
jgi:hypothetical protein